MWPPGVPVVANKTEKGNCIAFLGMTLDTIRMEARLPRYKLDKCLGLVRSNKDRKHISVIQLESLTGLLNFACQVVVPGRPFLRRLYSLKKDMKKRLPHYKLRLSAATRQDLVTWEGFLSHYNGETMFRSKHPLTAGQIGILVTTTKEGWRVEKGGQILHGNWPSTLRSRATEAGAALLPWLVVAKIWGPTLQDTRLVMEVDNDQLTGLVNSQNHKNKEVMKVVRAWVGLLLQYNIHCVARTVFLSTNNSHLLLIPTQVQPIVGDGKQPSPHPQQDLIQDWHWLLPIE